MASTSTAHVDKSFSLPSSFKFPTWKINQEIDLSNIHGLVNSNFFIMTEIDALFCHTCHRYRDEFDFSTEK